MVVRGVLTAVLAVCLIVSASAVVPTASVTSVAFSDLDLDIGQLGGTITWTAPASTTGVTKYNVYLATNAQGAGKTIIGSSILLGTTTASLPVNTAVGSFMYIVVMTANADGDQTTAPGSVLFEDQVAVISSLAFEDKDLDKGHIAGGVAWSLRGTAPVTSYKVYLAENGLGLNKVLQSEVLQGTTYAIAVDTAYTTHTYICVYAVSSLAMSSSPAAIQFYDVDSPVRNLAFTDLDLDVGQLGGTISWVAPSDTVEVTGYVVYRSTSAAAAGRDQIGTSAVGTLAQNVPENTALGTYAFYNVYSKSSLAVRTAPVSVSAFDNVAKASNIVFQDLDLDTNELGGLV